MGVINLSILVEKIKRKLIGSGFITADDIASTTSVGVIKVSSSTGTTTGVGGVLQGIGKNLDSYTSGSNAMLISKATIENIKEDVTARSLVGIAQAQITEPTAGTYTVKLTYDGAAWGVTITQDT